MEMITLAGGCFWCTEAVFRELKGVSSVKSGYMGGEEAYPTYEMICRGDTGYAEVIQIVFDPEIISLTDILEVFFTMHDPTTLNRQGADTGTQYRSAIFYYSPEQKEIAERVMRDMAPYWKDPIVTEVTQADIFYPAEDIHQNFYSNYPEQPYCSIVITPKMQKLRAKFAEKLKA